MEWLTRKRRRQRQDVSAFNALIAEPATGDFDMPANGRIRFIATAGAAAGDTAATLTGGFVQYGDEDGVLTRENVSTREIKTPEMVAGQAVVIDRIERGVNVDAETGFDVEVDTGLGVWKQIASIS